MLSAALLPSVAPNLSSIAVLDVKRHKMEVFLNVAACVMNENHQDA